MFKNFVNETSKVNPLLKVAKNQWVLSIIRNPNSKNPEHAFLVLEGVEATEIVIRKYELFIDNNKKGYSVIEEADPIRGTPSEITKKYEAKVLKDHPNARLHYKSWNISDKQAESFRADIEKDKKNPPKYNISGNVAISGQSNTGTGSSQKGHSCFTWAREKVNNIGDQAINIPVKIEDYIAAVTSRSVGPKDEQMCRMM